MKTKIYVSIVLAFTAFSLMGCFTTPQTTPQPLPFSFAEDGYEGGTARITFVRTGNKGVRLVDYEGKTMPAPAAGTYWEPAVLFPADKFFNVRVYIYWNGDQYGERRRGIFICPPLEANQEYKLWFKGGYRSGSLLLTYANVDSLNAKSEIIHEQMIPPVP